MRKQHTILSFTLLIVITLVVLGFYHHSRTHKEAETCSEPIEVYGDVNKVVLLRI